VCMSSRHNVFDVAVFDGCVLGASVSAKDWLLPQSWGFREAFKTSVFPSRRSSYQSFEQLIVFSNTYGMGKGFCLGSRIAWVEVKMDSVTGEGRWVLGVICYLRCVKLETEWQQMRLKT
jgi:hypothetical protein